MPDFTVHSTADTQMGTNSYLVEDPDTHDAVVIDANLEPEDMIALVGSRGVNVRAILLTHADIDHIAGLQRLREAFGDVPIAIHDLERQSITRGVPLRREMPAEMPLFEDVERLMPGLTYTAGSLTFEVLLTPGHSPGGVTLKLGSLLFTGDALFAGSIGRYDFSNSDGRALLQGIRDELLTQPDDSVVYAGHGPRTTIGQERETNPFLR
ncbi:MAG TPA: MBL fold metallo-hydrolase [Candidatus Dormibacteraeota bacterium]|nr:MBL fold metallo-hydrolase [Candidatus Dormibacteraeota bacterium]